MTLLGFSLRNVLPYRTRSGYSLFTCIACATLTCVKRRPDINFPFCTLCLFDACKSTLNTEPHRHA